MMTNNHTTHHDPMEEENSFHRHTYRERKLPDLLSTRTVAAELVVAGAKAEAEAQKEAKATIVFMMIGFFTDTDNTTYTQHKT